MANKGFRDTIQVEWVNVSYRRVVSLLFVALVAAVAGGGYWVYAHRVAPRSDARAAVERAENRLAEATDLSGDERAEEILANARLSLDEARSEFAATRYEGALVAAIRSENLSLQAISMAAGEAEKSRLVRFYRIEGEVRVKHAGAFSWRSANRGMVLRIGDQVKTSSSASCQLIYFDGTLTSIRPGSLLEIRDLYEDPVTKVRRVKEKLTWGEVEASTEKRNVRGSYHEVATEKIAARSTDAGEFRIAFDKKKKTSVVDVFDGKIEVSTKAKKETVDAGQRLRARSDGSLSGKQALPGVPRLITPSDQRVFIFEDPQKEKLTLSWEVLPGAARYRLTIADSSLFTGSLYDSERGGHSAVIDGVPPGSYFWRVAAVSKAGIRGPFSDARRFRVSSRQIRDRTDTEPPKLEITEFVPIGEMVIINGETEPGATLWIENSKIDVYDDGSFNAVVKLRREGLNELLLMAQDTAGNETTLRRSAYVEIY